MPRGRDIQAEFEPKGPRCARPQDSEAGRHTMRHLQEEGQDPGKALDQLPEARLDHRSAAVHKLFIVE